MITIGKVLLVCMLVPSVVYYLKQFNQSFRNIIDSLELLEEE